MGNKDSKNHGHHGAASNSTAVARTNGANDAMLENAYKRWCERHGGVSKEAFERVFGPMLGPKLWRYLKVTSTSEGVSLDEFNSKFGAMISSNGNDVCLSVLFGRESCVNSQDIIEAIHICRATAGVEYNERVDTKFLDAIIAALDPSNGTVHTDCLRTWTEDTCPRLTSSFKRTLSRGIQTAETHCDHPILPKSSWMSPMAIWLIQCCVPSYLIKVAASSSSAFEQLQASDTPSCVPWDLLYSSENDGLSPNRFEIKVFNYRSPTVTVLELLNGEWYCICVDEEWKYTTQRWGKSGCALYRLLPRFESIESGDPSGMILFNVKQRGIPQGLFIGSNPKNPAVSIDVEFSNVRSIEVWGCGSSDTYQAQQDFRQWEKRQVEKQQKVPLPGNWEDSPDRMLLEMGGVKTQHAEK